MVLLFFIIQSVTVSEANMHLSVAKMHQSDTNEAAVGIEDELCLLRQSSSDSSVYWTVRRFRIEDQNRIWKVG